MYRRPKLYDKLTRRLTRQLKKAGYLGYGVAASLARLTTSVELALETLMMLGLGGEPLTAVWVVLSGTQIRDPHFENLSDLQRHILANARVILSEFAGRFALEEALRGYVRDIPIRYRLYNFSPEKLDEQLISKCKTENINLLNRVDQYEAILIDWLGFKERKAKPPVQPEQIYEFRAEFDGLPPQIMRVSFTAEQAAYQTKPTRWFSTTSRPRNPISIPINDLCIVAEFFDDKDKNRKRHGSQSNTKTWLERLNEIEYYVVNADGTVQQSDTIILDGRFNLVGMVAAGKSTLALLIAGYFVMQVKHVEYFSSTSTPELPLRITLIVGDFLSSIRLVDLFNRYFCNDPETNLPIAVPLMGQTTRHEHLKQFYASRDYQEAVQEGRIHWGEWFLNPTCLLQGLLKDLKKPLLPGKEPCSSLSSVPPDTKTKPSYHLCPFFSVCPSQQRYHTLSNAQIWITTPGALGNATPPFAVERRRIYLGELVYEQSDLVVFDEADTVMDWFDRLYAQETVLTNRGKGILDEIHQTVSPYWSQHRLLPSSESRWIQAQNNGMSPLGHVLKQLDKREILRKWLSRGYFTARGLFFRLSRRLLGLKEFEDATSDEIRRANEQAIAPLLAVFDALFDNDPLSDPIPLNFRQDKPVTLKRLTQAWNARERDYFAFVQLREQAAYRLSDLMRQAMTTGDSTQNPWAIQLYIGWIKELIPDVERRQTILKDKLSRSDKKTDRDYEVDTLETLAYRLELTLNTTLLDRHNRIIFYEWHNRPSQVIKGVQPHRRVPSSLLDILPLPPSGRMFGIYYWPTSSGSSDRRDILSSFAYTSIGREYVLHFHELRCWLDGQLGPNVLLMSGTSYLPDSTRFHLGDRYSLPNGILRPHPEQTTIHEAIKQSHFSFIPQRDEHNQPIRVSGQQNMLEPLGKIMWRLAERQGGILGSKLRELEQLGKANPSMWADRARLLLYVNSYEQAEWCARQLAQRWPEIAHEIGYLVRSKNMRSDQSILAAFGTDQQILRGDIEQFVSTRKRILIAPLQAVGRGFNILNKAGIAAFGAVYFLVRPMPHPFDTPAILQELNRRALDWASDPDFSAWQADGIYRKGVALRKEIMHYWSLIEHRYSFRTLWDEPSLHLFPRNDVAATTAGILIQAVGRLLRGGVPFCAYFVDSAWADESAKPVESGQSRLVDTPKESLLAAMIEVLANYVADSAVAESLYGSILERLERTENFDYVPE